MNRRKFLKIFVLGIAVIAGIVGIISTQRSDSSILSSIRALYSWLINPTLSNKPTGKIDGRTIEVLLVTSEILCGTSIERKHYKDYFCWCSENLRGYKTIYEQFKVSLDHSAKQSFGCYFVDCDKSMQLQIIKKILQSHKTLLSQTTSRLYRIKIGIFERDWQLFNKYIFSEILNIFARTDAWVLLGYESWPGIPRGLNKYRKAIQNK